MKISGMIDESMDKEQMKKSPEPWEFRAKPAWQRLIIMLGGVTVNFLFGVFLYSMILYVWNDTYLKNDNGIYGVSLAILLKKLALKMEIKFLIDGLACRKIL